MNGNLRLHIKKDAEAKRKLLGCKFFLAIALSKTIRTQRKSPKIKYVCIYYPLFERSSKVFDHIIDPDWKFCKCTFR